MTTLSIGLLYGATILIVMFAGMPLAFALGAASTWGPPPWIPYSLTSVGTTLLSSQLLFQVIGQLTWRARP